MTASTKLAICNETSEWMVWNMKTFGKNVQYYSKPNTIYKKIIVTFAYKLLLIIITNHRDVVYNLSANLHWFPATCKTRNLKQKKIFKYTSINSVK